MDIRIICLGTLKEEYLKIAQEDLLGNISGKNRIGSCTLIELREEALKDSASEAMIRKALEAEGDRILEKLQPSGRIIALDIQGKKADGDFFRSLAGSLESSGINDLTFLIGGSHGLSERVKRKSDRISFSSLTYPHQLFRIALMEALALYL